MNIKYDSKEKILFLELTEEIDHHKVEEIRRRADYEIERRMPKKVIFDFTNVGFMDSAGIGMLIGRYKLANMLGGTVEMINPNDAMKRIFSMSGIFRIIPIVEMPKMNVNTKKIV